MQCKFRERVGCAAVDQWVLGASKDDGDEVTTWQGASINVDDVVSS